MSEQATPAPKPQHELDVLYARLAERNAHLFPGRLQVPRAARTCVKGPAALEREIQAFERFRRRHEGRRRVLWTVLDACSPSEPEWEGVVWIRHASGLKERVPIRQHPALQAAVPGTGQLADLNEAGTAIFEQFVRPRLTPEQVRSALKVGYGRTCVHRMTALRDHPFTPGVREFYELRTEYSVSALTPRTGQHAPAKYCRFTCTQTTTRVQRRGRDLLLIQGGQVRNVKYGRFDPAGLTPEVCRGLQALAWELARETCCAGELAQLREAFAPEDQPRTTERLGPFLFAVQHPDYLNVPALIEHVQLSARREYRAWLRRRPGATTLLRELCGSLPRGVRPLLARLDVLTLAASLHRSGMRSPDLKAQVLNAYAPALREHRCGPPFDARWYVELAGGEQQAARRLIRTFREGHAVSGLALLLGDTERLWQDVQAAQPGYRPGRDQLDPLALHDHLARLHTRIRTENRPIPSGTDGRLSHLDADLPHAARGTLHFRRARETHDLIHVSETLHNCVSSYAGAAIRGEVVIVVARDGRGTPVYCLEVRGRAVHQFKRDRNQGLRDQTDLAAAFGYLRQARLGIRTHDLASLCHHPGLPQAAVSIPEPEPDDLPF
ncbi:hypothetical protein DAERI_020319 [Deinococcus aerius]|uniref:Uncharacterized protein n=1 Tax=Deinococcus aerius TaxID=200253 RepID=A0A2I9CSQ4_9DEIO|nr:PcfJ domain-containing protein [Deinococcus aerius]GBF04722.1 hypothetical protein DAERI_020319 [Deinococcus aerius]